MIVRIVPIVPVVSKMFRRSGRSYGNATQTTANDPHDWDDLGRLDRVEFYPDDRDDHVNFEAIMETLPDDWDDRDDRRLSQKSSLLFQFYSNKFGPDGAEAQKITHMFAGVIWN